MGISSLPAQGLCWEHVQWRYGWDGIWLWSWNFPLIFYFGGTTYIVCGYIFKNGLGSWCNWLSTESLKYIYYKMARWRLRYFIIINILKLTFWFIWYLGKHHQAYDAEESQSEITKYWKTKMEVLDKCEAKYMHLWTWALTLTSPCISFHSKAKEDRRKLGESSIQDHNWLEYQQQKATIGTVC